MTTTSSPDESGAVSRNEPSKCASSGTRTDGDDVVATETGVRSAAGCDGRSDVGVPARRAHPACRGPNTVQVTMVTMVTTTTPTAANAGARDRSNAGTVLAMRPSVAATTE